MLKQVINYVGDTHVNVEGSKLLSLTHQFQMKAV